MDGEHFDRLIRALTTSASRRGTLTGLVAGLLAALAPDADPEAARRGKTAPSPNNHRLHAERKRGKHGKQAPKGKKGKKKRCLPGGTPTPDPRQCCNGSETKNGVCCGAIGEACPNNTVCCNGLCFQGQCVACLPAGATRAGLRPDQCCSGFASGDECCASAAACCGQLGDDCSESHCCKEGFCSNGKCSSCRAEGETTANPGECCSKTTAGDVCCGAIGGICERSRCCEPSDRLVNCVDGTCFKCETEGTFVGDARICCGGKTNAQGLCCAAAVGDACGASDCCAEGACDGHPAKCVSCLDGGAQPFGGNASLCCSGRMRNGRCCGAGPDCCFTNDDCPPCQECSVINGTCSHTDPKCCVAANGTVTHCGDDQTCCDGQCITAGATCGCCPATSPICCEAVCCRSTSPICCPNDTCCYSFAPVCCPEGGCCSEDFSGCCHDVCCRNGFVCCGEPGRSWCCPGDDLCGATQHVCIDAAGRASQATAEPSVPMVIPSDAAGRGGVERSTDGRGANPSGKGAGSRRGKAHKRDNAPANRHRTQRHQGR